MIYHPVCPSAQKLVPSPDPRPQPNFFSSKFTAKMDPISAPTNRPGGSPLPLQYPETQYDPAHTPDDVDQPRPLPPRNSTTPVQHHEAQYDPPDRLNLQNAPGQSTHPGQYQDTRYDSYDVNQQTPSGESTPPVQYQDSRYDSAHGIPAEAEPTGRIRTSGDTARHSNGRVSILGALGAWKLEAIAVVLAVGVLAAIFITLHHFDGRNVPTWPVSLTLNSLVAIYATILRALLLFAMAEVLSQEKWYWFRRPRPLRHLDDFDLASRGVLGSIKLLRVAFSS